MTDPQRIKFYFPRWNQCARVNGWYMAKGRLVCDAAANRTRSEWHHRVWAIAEQFALQEARAVGPEDLRYACNLLGTSTDPIQSHKMSTKDLNNRETNRIVHGLFELLIEPLSLAALKIWLNPEICERDGLIANLKRTTPEATLRAISGNVYGTKVWDERPLQNLRWMKREVKNRRQRFNRPAVASPKSETQAARPQTKSYALDPAKTFVKSSNNPF